MDPTVISSFFDEIEKIAQQRDNKITKKRLKRLARYGAAGAAGAGVGYATTKLVGRPLEKKLVKSNIVSRGPAKALKYSLGLGTALAAATALSQGAWGDKLRRKIEHGRDG